MTCVTAAGSIGKCAAAVALLLQNPQRPHTRNNRREKEHRIRHTVSTRYMAPQAWTVGQGQKYKKRLQFRNVTEELTNGRTKPLTELRIGN